MAENLAVFPPLFTCLSGLQEFTTSFEGQIFYVAYDKGWRNLRIPSRVRRSGFFFFRSVIGFLNCASTLRTDTFSQSTVNFCRSNQLRLWDKGLWQCQIPGRQIDVGRNARILQLSFLLGNFVQLFPGISRNHSTCVFAVPLDIPHNFLWNS